MEAGDLTHLMQSLWVPKHVVLLPLLPFIPIYHHQETRCQRP